MTEADWQAGTDPGPMLTFLGHHATERKLHLFAAACRTHARDYVRFSKSDPGAIDALEQETGEGVEWAAGIAAACAALCGDVDGDRTHPKGLGDAISTERVVQKAQSRIVREIFGDPFHPVSFDPAWR